MEQKLKYLHPFIYDEELISNLIKKNEERKKEKEKFFEEIKYNDNLLIYLDLMFKNSSCKQDRIRKIDVLKYYKHSSNNDFYITDFKKLFNFNLKKVEIYFFPNNIAFLVLEVEFKEDYSIEEMYYFNSLFISTFKQGKNETYITKKIKFSLKSPKDKEKLQCISENSCTTENDNYIFTPKGIKKDFDKYNPYKDISFLKERVGLLIEDEIPEKKNFENLHFGNFNDIINTFKEDSLKAIHFDTFITSLFVDFAKINKKIEYYDNFNPLGTNYMNLYTTFSEENLEEVYNENFSKYEPFLHNKKRRGVIKRIDFFDMYQTQADWFIIANEYNVVNIIAPESLKNVKGIIENQRFLVYLFVNFQNLYLSLIQIKAILTNTNNILKTYKFASSSINQYIEFLNNYNFIDVSDEPSLNNFYKFLRKSKNIEDKLSNLKNISSYNKSFKDIANNIIKNKIILILVIFIILPMSLKLINMLNSYILDKIKEGNKFYIALVIGIIAIVISYIFDNKNE